MASDFFLFNIEKFEVILWSEISLLNIPEQTPFQPHQWLWQEGFSPSTPRLLERTLFHILLCRHQSSENKHNCLLLTNLEEQLQMSRLEAEGKFLLKTALFKFSIMQNYEFINQKFLSTFKIKTLQKNNNTITKNYAILILCSKKS